MKALFLLAILAVCLNLYHTKLPDTLAELMKSWTDPQGSLAKKISLSIDKYAYWTSLAKFVLFKEKLQPTYVLRFCKCERRKRSFLDLFKRDNHQSPPEKKRVRKEWRRMSKAMRKAFIKHFSNLAVKQDGEPQSRLHVFANFHRSVESPGAHRGPAFLPWHRELLFRLENALVDDGYTGGLPYWDSGLDHDLENAEDSAIFTTKELGVVQGLVKKPFARNTVEGDCITEGFDKTITRNVDGNHDNLFSRQKRDNLPWDAGYSEFRLALEGDHDWVHSWFGRGSHMLDFNCVGFDPIFYMHHAYIDYLWEVYRQEHQTLQQRESDYPTGRDIESEHQKYSTMLPFDDKENIDGLKNQYTSTFYSYQPSPDKCKTDKDCKSSFLWCHNRLCLAKVKERSSCNRSLSAEQCYCEKGKPICDEDGDRCRCQGKGK